MTKFLLTGDILRAGVISVEADTIDEAIDKAEEGDFTVSWETDKTLGFVFASHAEDEAGNDLDHLFLADGGPDTHDAGSCSCPCHLEDPCPTP